MRKSKKRSFDETEANESKGIQLPHKKHKNNCNTLFPIETMQCSINPSYMQKMIDFISPKPESFVKQMLDQCIEQYEIFTQKKLAKELSTQTSLTVNEATDKQNQAKYLSIVDAIEQSQTTKILQIPQIISKNIAQFAIGKIFVCVHTVCDKEIFILPSNTKKYNKQRLFCDWTCKHKPMNCDQCHTDYNINTKTCVGDYCNEYICENRKCLKNSKICGHMNCEYRYCSNCVKSEQYLNCDSCSKVNVGCRKCDVWCTLCKDHHHQFGVNGKRFICIDGQYCCQECAKTCDLSRSKITYLNK